jgi:hypothetical protein
VTPNEVKALFQAEHDRFKQDWFVKIRRQIIMSPDGSEERVFQEWVIAQMAAMSAAIKRLMIEARKNKGKK